jgi:hypothetical protein
MKKLFYPLFASAALLMGSCTTTFGGTVLVLGFRDVLLYVFIALIIAGVVAFVHPAAKRRKLFLIWFIVSLGFTPLPGLIYFLYKVTKKKEVE